MLTILIYILLVVFTFLCFVILGVIFVVTLPFDRRRCAVHWFSRLWTKGYFALVPGWKVIVEGRELVDSSKPWVVVVNHRSMLDILLMYTVPLNFRWVSKKEVYRWPLFGWVLWMHGDVTIDRGSGEAMKKMLTDGKKWFSRNVSLMIFPEGSRSQSEHVGSFKEGAFLLAKRAGVGIIPCAACGTDTAHIGWKVNLKNRFRVKILPPLSAEQVSAIPTRELAQKMQELISSEYDLLKKKDTIEK